MMVFQVLEARGHTGYLTFGTFVPQPAAGAAPEAPAVSADAGAEGVTGQAASESSQ